MYICTYVFVLQVRQHETLIAPSGPRPSALHAATAAAAAAVAAAAAAGGADTDGETSLGDGGPMTEIVLKQPAVEQAVDNSAVSSTSHSTNATDSAANNNNNNNNNKGAASRPVELDDLEILLTERLGSLSANTANRLANIINDG